MSAPPAGPPLTWSGNGNGTAAAAAAAGGNGHAHHAHTPPGFPPPQGGPPNSTSGVGVGVGAVRNGGHAFGNGAAPQSAPMYGARGSAAPPMAAPGQVRVGVGVRVEVGVGVGEARCCFVFFFSSGLLCLFRGWVREGRCRFGPDFQLQAVFFWCCVICNWSSFVPLQMAHRHMYMIVYEVHLYDAGSTTDLNVLRTTWHDVAGVAHESPRLVCAYQRCVCTVATCELCFLERSSNVCVAVEYYCCC